MIEEIVIGWLNSHLSVPVHAKEPDNEYPGDIEMTERPKFCIVQKTGSGRTNGIRQATIAVQSYAKSIYEAAQLNEQVIEAMNQMVVLDSISAVKLNSDYEYSRESTKQPRYQAVFDIYYY